MMSKEYLKKLGVLGVSFGLLTSPLAFADFHEEEQPPEEEEETLPDSGGNLEADTGLDTVVYGSEEDEKPYEEEEEEEEWEEEEEGSGQGK
ncbi:hypothetical protein EQG41_20270 [Billgrantia azerbaijanica]|nr:hypothetical protein EQG41_20270 [Halomonas azerbaijanica]